MFLTRNENENFKMLLIRLKINNMNEYTKRQFERIESTREKVISNSRVVDYNKAISSRRVNKKRKQLRLKIVPIGMVRVKK